MSRIYLTIEQLEALQKLATEPYDWEAYAKVVLDWAKQADKEIKKLKAQQTPPAQDYSESQA